MVEQYYLSYLDSPVFGCQNLVIHYP
jgi:hypothetical protein